MSSRSALVVRYLVIVVSLFNLSFFFSFRVMREERRGEERSGEKREVAEVGTWAGIWGRKRGCWGWGGVGEG